MLSFDQTWPYDKMMDDIYIHECPFCHQTNILTHFKQEDLELAKEGVKRLLIMPCCREKLTILKADDDYFWTDEKLRNR